MSVMLEAFAELKPASSAEFHYGNQQNNIKTEMFHKNKSWLAKYKRSM